MKKTFILIYTFFYFLNFSHALEIQKLTNVSYFDVHSGEIKNHFTFSWDKVGIIKEVRPSTIEELKKAQKKIYIIPGLVDSHIHLFQSGGLYARPDVLAGEFIRPYQDETNWLIQKWPEWLKSTASLGMTEAIDVAGPLWNKDIKKISNLQSSSTRLSISGPLISTYDDKELNTVIDKPVVYVTSPAEAKKEALRDIRSGVDILKVWFIPSETKSADQLAPIVIAVSDIAHKNNKITAVHADDVHTASIALKSGADYLVHAPADQSISKNTEFLNILSIEKEKRLISMSATAMVGRNYCRALSGGFKPTEFEMNYADPRVLLSFNDLEMPLNLKGMDPKCREKSSIRGRVRSTNLKEAWNLGINVVVGTDAGNIGTFHGTSLFDEMEEMVEAGLSRSQVLIAATYNAAKLLKKENLTGSIEVGKIADFVVLDSNPILSFKNLRKPVQVFKSGKIVNYKENLEQRILRKILKSQISGKLSPIIESFSPDFNWSIPAAKEEQYTHNKSGNITIPGRALLKDDQKRMVQSKIQFIYNQQTKDFEFNKVTF